MLGGSCSPCCSKSCDAFVNAQNIEVLINSQNVYYGTVYFLTQAVGNYAQGHRFSAVTYFPGYQYSGTFGLSKIVDLPYRKVFRYDYPTSASNNVCSGNSLVYTLESSPEDNDTLLWTLYAAVSLKHFVWIDMGANTLLQPQGIGCTQSTTASVYTSYRIIDALGGGLDPGIVATCDAVNGPVYGSTRYKYFDVDTYGLWGNLSPQPPALLDVSLAEYSVEKYGTQQTQSGFKGTFTLAPPVMIS